MTPKAGPGLFKRAVACVLMVTINISSLGQAVAQIIRGPVIPPKNRRGEK